MFQLIFIFTLYISTINCDEVFENSTEICTRCTCAQSANAQILSLKCIEMNFHHMLSNWPPHNKTILASFTGNVITTLERLPPTDAEVEVVLSNCSIKNLNPGLFEGVKNVKLVDLSYNLLEAEELSSDKFKGPHNNTYYEPIGIETLDLSYNQIHSLNKNIFEHMPDLQRLSLEGNDFIVLDVHTQMALSSIPNLLSLNLANNELTELVEAAIETYTKLNELDLGRNRLEFVPQSLYHVGKTLEVLRIDHNPIFEMIAETFLGLENILELSANNLSDLKYINANTFVPMPKLKKLSLSNNFLLTDIDREAFRVNHTLEEFYLNNNRLFKIDYELLNWSYLHVFEFKDNPLMCSCSLYNISKALSDSITRQEDGPYCIDPRNGQAQQVFYLKSDICSFNVNSLLRGDYIKHSFTVMRISLVVLSVALMMAATIAVVLGFTRYRRIQRNKNYPFASQILYNPLSTNARF